MNFATAGAARPDPSIRKGMPAVIVINDRARGLVLKHGTSAERLLARLRSGSLDRRLAAGTPAETGPLLALRACTIIQPTTRRRFARSLQHLVRHAAGPQRHRPVTLSALTCRNLRDAANVLNRLIDRLTSPRPVSARGMAMVKILLTDGAGPLYYPTHADEFPLCVHEALNALDDPMIP